MNKNALIALSVIFLLLLGGGVYALFGKAKSPSISPTTDVQQNESSSQEGITSGQKSLKDLLLAKVPQKCTYTDLLENVDIEGNVYVSSGKVRTDFSSTVEGKVTSGHTIYDGKLSYIWTDGMTTGFKIALDPDVTQSPKTSDQSVDLTKTIDYNCSPWIPDQSLFTPPSNVTFSEFNVPTIPATTTSDGNTQNSCNLCNSLSGDAKTQCLTSLNCN